MNGNRRDSANASAPSVGRDGIAPHGGVIDELNESWFEQAGLWVGEALVSRGRPRTPAPKVAINIRLSPDVLARFKSTGRGWQTRINQVLEQWLADHPEIR